MDVDHYAYKVHLLSLYQCDPAFGDFFFLHLFEKKKSTILIGTVLVGFDPDGIPDWF